MMFYGPTTSQQTAKHTLIPDSFNAFSRFVFCVIVTKSVFFSFLKHMESVP